jgi:tetratricopeptide (TPR) repeat protein
MIITITAVLSVIVQAQEDNTEADEILINVLEVLGANEIVQSPFELTFFDNGEVIHGYYWFSPEGVRLDVNSPFYLAGLSFAYKPDRVKILNRGVISLSDYELQSLGRLMVICGSGMLFDWRLDIASILIVTQRVLEEDEFFDRPVYKLVSCYSEETGDECEDKAELFIDKETYLPLALRYMDVSIIEATDIILDDVGEIKSVLYESYEFEDGTVFVSEFAKVGRAFFPVGHLLQIKDGDGYSFVFKEPALSDMSQNEIIPPGLFPEVEEMLMEATVLSYNEQYEQSIEVVEQVIKEDPYSVEAYLILGYNLHCLGDWMGAIAAFEQVLMLDPGNISAANNLAYMYIDYEINIERGLEIARLVVDDEPEAPEYLDTLAWGLYKVGEYEEALELMLKVVDIESEDSYSCITEKCQATTFYHLACIYVALGETELAKEAAQTAFELYPDDFLIMELLEELD